MDIGWRACDIPRHRDCHRHRDDGQRRGDHANPDKAPTNRLLRLARPRSLRPIRRQHGDRLVVSWRDVGRLRLGCRLAFDKFDGLGSARGLNGRGSLLGLDGTVDTVGNRTRGVSAHGPRCGHAPLRLACELLVLSDRLPTLGPDRRPYTLPQFLREQRRCWRSRLGSGRASHTLRQLPAAVLVSQCRHPPGRCAHTAMQTARYRGAQNQRLIQATLRIVIVTVRISGQDWRPAPAQAHAAERVFLT